MLPLLYPLQLASVAVADILITAGWFTVAVAVPAGQVLPSVTDTLYVLAANPVGFAPLPLGLQV